MNSIKYGIIGNNWGLKILKILESINKYAKLIKIKSPKKYNIDVKFACNVYKNIKYLIDSKK